MKLTPFLEQKTFPLAYQSYLQKNRHILEVDIEQLASPDTYEGQVVTTKFTFLQSYGTYQLI